jgi:K+-transporting ATPase A subunit
MQGKSNFYDEQEQKAKSKGLLFTICYFNYLISFAILLFAFSKLKTFFAIAICFLTKKPKSKTTQT